MTLGSIGRMNPSCNIMSFLVIKLIKWTSRRCWVIKSTVASRVLRLFWICQIGKLPTKICQSVYYILILSSCFYVAELLIELLRDLKSVQPKYCALGIHLLIELSQIKTWEKEYLNNGTRIFSEMISYLLSKHTRDNCLKLLFSGLDHIDECVLSKDMRNKYTPVPGNRMLYILFL